MIEFLNRRYKSFVSSNDFKETLFYSVALYIAGLLISLGMAFFENKINFLVTILAILYFVLILFYLHIFLRLLKNSIKTNEWKPFIGWLWILVPIINSIYG